MGEEITPFEVVVPEAALEDLAERLARTRWPEVEPVDDWSQGVPLAYLQDLCRHWAGAYDWRAREARLNAYPQGRTELDGLAVHFLHVRSPVEDALPLVLTHGWPGSVVEFYEVIGPLTDPAAHGGDPADAFHVVCPSLPGYGWSDKPTAPGWGVDRTAAAWAQLMARLGYARYGAQGGDWGAAVTTSIGAQDAEHVAGIHLNMVIAAPGREDREDLSEREEAALASLTHYADWDSGYSKEQSTRPQTIGYSLVDSPVGECAWILEKFWSWTDTDGDPVGALGADRILDNVMLYWLSASGASSARLYWESFRSMTGGAVAVPTGASIFPKEIFRPSRRWAERRYENIVFWEELDRGGHFAAFEQPELFVEQVRAFFRLVR
ncbi:MAG TPA: alpha/beta fold hydrolase [Acidimicrobiales bacterium]|nr:alpha/beta fold hydrolase [Acidimicrobiales bacterium]